MDDQRQLSTADVGGAAGSREEFERERDGEGAPHEHAAGPASAAGTERDGRLEPLLPGDASEGYRSRWKSIQTRFVDEPRSSVEEAEALVDDVMQHLARGFAEERGRLESRWDQGDDVSTEDLRVTLQRYRSFFERLLAV